MKKRKIPSLFRHISNISVFLFPFFLIFYLILFLLENVFPGFVSNNFDLNFFLIPVVFLALIAAFSVGKEKKEEPGKMKRWDFVIVASLSILSFIILLYKTWNMGLLGFFISIISALLAVLIAIAIWASPESEENQEEIEETSRIKLKTQKFNREKYGSNRFILPPFGASVIVLILIIVGISLYLIAKQNKETLRKIETKSEIQVQKSHALKKLTKIDGPSQSAHNNTQVTILNGSGIAGSASAMSKFFQTRNFDNIKIGNAKNSNYIGATLQFGEEDSLTASYINFLLLDKYKIVNMLPSSNSSQSGIILIIGK